MHDMMRLEVMLGDLSPPCEACNLEFVLTELVEIKLSSHSAAASNISQCRVYKSLVSAFPNFCVFGSVRFTSVLAHACRMCGNDAFINAHLDMLPMASDKPGESPCRIFWTRTLSKF